MLGHGNRILLVDVFCGNVDHIRQLHYVGHGEGLGRLGEYERSALHGKASGRKHGYDALVECALNETQVTRMFGGLDFEMHLAEGACAALALHGGQRLAEDGDEHLLVVGLAELVIGRSRPRIAVARLYLRLLGDYYIRRGAGLLERLLQEPAARRIVSVVFADALRHAEEFNPLGVVAEPAALPYRVGRSLEQQAEVVGTAEHEHMRIAVVGNAGHAAVV